MDLESKYLQLEQENKQLKLNYDIIKQSYEKLKISRQKDKALIKSLSSELEKYKSQHLPLKNSFQGSPSGKYDQLSLFSPKPARRLPNTPDSMSPSQSTGKTPQVNPDQSVRSDQSLSFFYQAFFVVGIGKNQLKSLHPDILYENLADSNSISYEIRRVLPDLCFPTGVEARKLKLSGSASDLNNVLYSQVPNKRNNSCFLFTLRAEEGIGEGLHPDLPNSEQELLYFICIKIDDLCIDNQDIEWVVPKCYVIASYLPIIDLHFDFLRSLLLIKRLHRTNLIASENSELSSLIQEECCTDEIKQLNCYAECDSIAPGLSIELGIKKIEQLKFTFPNDLSTIDLIWLSMPLFTSLKFQDFFWLLSAILQEKSVVFVSQNLGLLSSCVLSVHALLRPFKWPNLMVPIVSNSLRELLEAPIPLLAGLPYIGNQERQNFSNIIWVLLDEPNLNRKIQGMSGLVQEVIEPEAPQLRSNLLQLYRVFECENHKFIGSVEEKTKCYGIAQELKKYYEKIISAFKGCVLNDTNLTNVLVKNFPIYDHKFIRVFTQTLIFSNKIQENSN